MALAKEDVEEVITVIATMIAVTHQLEIVKEQRQNYLRLDKMRCSRIMLNVTFIINLPK